MRPDGGPDMPDPQKPHVCYPTDPEEPRRSLCRVCLTPVWRLEQLEDRWAHQFMFLEPTEGRTIEDNPEEPSTGAGHSGVMAGPAPNDS